MLSWIELEPFARLEHRDLDTPAGNGPDVQAHVTVEAMHRQINDEENIQTSRRFKRMVLSMIASDT